MSRATKLRTRDCKRAGRDKESHSIGLKSRFNVQVGNNSGLNRISLKIIASLPPQIKQTKTKSKEELKDRLYIMYNAHKKGI